MGMQSIDLSRQGMEPYWDMVRETLERILNNHDAWNLVNNLRNAVEQSPENEQELFYHAEPLTTAMDIDGINAGQLTDYHLQQYFDLTLTRGWGRA